MGRSKLARPPPTTAAAPAVIIVVVVAVPPCSAAGATAAAAAAKGLGPGRGQRREGDNSEAGRCPYCRRRGSFFCIQDALLLLLLRGTAGLSRGAAETAIPQHRCRGSFLCI